MLVSYKTAAALKIETYINLKNSTLKRRDMINYDNKDECYNYDILME